MISKRLRRQMEYARLSDEGRRQSWGKRCTIRGCKSKVSVRGLCKAHYQKAWKENHPHYDRDIWRGRQRINNSDPTLPAIARERRLLIRLKRKFGIPYRLPLQLQALTPEQIVKRWRTFC